MENVMELCFFQCGNPRGIGLSPCVRRQNWEHRGEYITFSALQLSTWIKNTTAPSLILAGLW